MRLVHKTASPAATRISPRPRIGPGLAVGVATALLVTVVLSVDLLPRVYEVHEGDVAPQSNRSCPGHLPADYAAADPGDRVAARLRRRLQVVDHLQREPALAAGRPEGPHSGRPGRGDQS